MRRTWPFTGRSVELARALDAVTSERPCGALLVGAAGVGKTRIARECASSVTQQGRQVHWVVASASARALPLGAFMPVLGDLGHEPARILRHATKQLVPDGDASRLVLAVDDVQHLDELSALLVHRMVTEEGAAALLTQRAGTTAPSAVSDLWKDSHVERVDVPPLTEREVETLLERVLDGPLDPGTARRFSTWSRGNSLYLRQLVEAELAAGRLRRDDGVWSVDEDDHPTLSPGLVELVELRLAGLDPGAREVVDLLALAEPLELGMLESLVGAAAVEAAEQAGVLGVDPEDPAQARLVHPLLTEVRRSRMGAVRARRLSGRLVGALAASGDRSESADLRRAVLTLDSGLPPEADLLTRAAVSASRLVDLPLATRLARAAVDAGGGFVPLLTLGLVLSFGSRAPEAEVALTQLADTADRNGDPTLRTVATVTRAANLLWAGRDPVGAERVVRSALADCSDEDGRNVLLAVQSAVLACTGRHREAVEAATSVLARELPGVAALAATYGLVGALAVLGRADDLRAPASRGYAVVAETPETTFLRFGLAQLHLTGLRLAGAVREAERVATDRRSEGLDLPGVAQPYSLGLVGHAALARGQVGTAARILTRVLRDLPASESTGFRHIAALHLSQALAMTGQVARAGRVLAAVVEHPHPAFAFLDPEVLLARAWVVAGEGTVTEAVELCRRAAELARQLGQPGHEVFALDVAVGFGDRRGEARLHELARVVQGPRAEIAAAHATALVAEDGNRLGELAEELHQRGDELSAANAAAQAAEAYGRAGDGARAAAARLRAGSLREGCDGGTTPALLALTHPLPLTARQREIASLAARGLSNRAIAERLVVSVRTVEGHLYQVSTRLGLSGRRDLARLLGQRDAPSASAQIE